MLVAKNRDKVSFTDGRLLDCMLLRERMGRKSVVSRENSKIFLFRAGVLQAFSEKDKPAL